MQENQMVLKKIMDVSKMGIGMGFKGTVGRRIKDLTGFLENAGKYKELNYKIVLYFRVIHIYILRS
jgi:hypothetical protein